MLGQLKKKKVYRSVPTIVFPLNQNAISVVSCYRPLFTALTKSIESTILMFIHFNANKQLISIILCTISHRIEKPF